MNESKRANTIENHLERKKMGDSFLQQPQTGAQKKKHLELAMMKKLNLY